MARQKTLVSSKNSLLVAAICQQPCPGLYGDTQKLPYRPSRVLISSIVFSVGVPNSHRKALPSMLLVTLVSIWLFLPKLVAAAAQGNCAAALCMFGQTGSGKTHSMAAAIERVAQLLFQDSKSNSSSSTSALDGQCNKIMVKCYEVYGKACFDLLDHHTMVPARENANGDTQVRFGALEAPCCVHHMLWWHHQHVLDLAGLPWAQKPRQLAAPHCSSSQFRYTLLWAHEN